MDKHPSRYLRRGTAEHVHRPIPEIAFANIITPRPGKYINLPYTSLYSTWTAPLNSTSIPKKNTDEHEKAPGQTGKVYKE